jgi:hypothetical protein
MRNSWQKNQVYLVSFIINDLLIFLKQLNKTEPKCDLTIL